MRLHTGARLNKGARRCQRLQRALLQHCWFLRHRLCRQQLKAFNLVSIGSIRDGGGDGDGDSGYAGGDVRECKGELVRQSVPEAFEALCLQEAGGQAGDTNLDGSVRGSRRWFESAVQSGAAVAGKVCHISVVCQ